MKLNNQIKVYCEQCDNSYYDIEPNMDYKVEHIVDNVVIVSLNSTCPQCGCENTVEWGEYS